MDYANDAFDRMVKRVKHPDEGDDKTTLFFHDGTSEEVALETEGGATVKTRHILDSSGYPIGKETYGSQTRRSYLVTDPRDNVTQLLAHDEKVRAVYSYDPFGKEKPALTKTTADWDSRLRFQSAPRDETTGAYAIGPRMYDPQINRFVGADMYASAAANMDLATDPLTGNRYLYAGANPVGMIDDGHGPGCGRLASSRWESCKNTWLAYRNANAGRIGCAECREMYAAFNQAHAEFGLGPAPSGPPSTVTYLTVNARIPATPRVDWGAAMWNGLKRAGGYFMGGIRCFNAAAGTAASAVGAVEDFLWGASNGIQSGGRSVLWGEAIAAYEIREMMRSARSTPGECGFD